MADGRLSIFLGGDALITEPWSEYGDPAFAGLLAEMRAADVTVINLETVIHEYKGFAQPESGGTYMASPPPIAAELKWGGVDMVANANNHAFDYGTTGILETLEHVEAAGMELAGAGRDLQAARAPAFAGNGNATVGMVAMTASFVPYGRASRSRPDLQGRPGVNPLRMTRRLAGTLTPEMVEFLHRRGLMKRRLARGDVGRFLGFRIMAADKAGFAGFQRRGLPADLEANLAAIKAASEKADVTIASIHDHNQKNWLPLFARQAIDSGADIVFVHGPHEVRAIELHRGKPIFYCLGDFVYQPHRITRFPAEMYETHKLGDDATADELLPTWDKWLGIGNKRKTFESFSSVLDFAGGKLERIRLLPLDLQFDAPPEVRGRPRPADPVLGRRIIEEVAALSRKHRTTIRYDAACNEGVVELPRA